MGRILLKEHLTEYSVRNKKGEDIPVYSVTNTEGFCKDYFSKDVSSKDRTTYKIVPKGCFAYNPSRINVGSVDCQRVEDQVIVSPLYVVFSTSDRIDNEYLYYFLKSDICNQLIKANATGSVRDNLKFTTLQSFSIPDISIEEQKKVANTIKHLNKIINEYRECLKKYDELVKSRFIEMFGDVVINEKNWNRLTLGDICEVGSSKRVFEKDYVLHGIPFFRTKEIVELSKGNKITTELFITEEHFEQLKSVYGAPQKDDLLISAVGTIGTIWIVSGDFDFYFKDGNLIQIKSSSKFNSIYMKYLLDELIANYKLEMSTGTAYSALTIAGLKKMLVYDVPIELQNQFATFVEQTDKSKFEIQKSLEKLEILKKSLMQQYFG